MENGPHIGHRTIISGLSSSILSLAFCLFFASLKSHGLPSVSSVIVRSRAQPSFMPSCFAMAVIRGGEYNSDTSYLPFAFIDRLCLRFLGSCMAGFFSRSLRISLTSGLAATVLSFAM